jgi:hypothetical protein
VSEGSSIAPEWGVQAALEWAVRPARRGHTLCIDVWNELGAEKKSVLRKKEPRWVGGVAIPLGQLLTKQRHGAVQARVAPMSRLGTAHTVPRPAPPPRAVRSGSRELASHPIASRAHSNFRCAPLLSS